MKTDPKAALMIIAVIAVFAFITGCVFGSFHIGADVSEQLIPTSLTSSDDMIKPVKETNTTMYNISIKQPQKKVVQNKTKNYSTNNTTNNASNNTNSSSSSQKNNSKPRNNHSNNT